MSISGYKLLLAATWIKHCHARIVLLAKANLSIKEIECPKISDLPVITVEVDTIKESKTRIKFVYREYTNYVSGLSTLDAQELRLDRTLTALKILAIMHQNCLIMGAVSHGGS